MRGLLTALLLFAAASGEAQTLEISASPNHFGCDQVRGAFVAFLSPGNGSVLLATRSFPGGARVGSVENGRLAVEVQGYGEVHADVGGAESGTPIWAAV